MYVLVCVCCKIYNLKYSKGSYKWMAKNDNVTLCTIHFKLLDNYEWKL